MTLGDMNLMDHKHPGNKETKTCSVDEQYGGVNRCECGECSQCAVNPEFARAMSCPSSTENPRREFRPKGQSASQNAVMHVLSNSDLVAMASMAAGKICSCVLAWKEQVLLKPMFHCFADARLGSSMFCHVRLCKPAYFRKALEEVVQEAAPAVVFFDEAPVFLSPRTVSTWQVLYTSIYSTFSRTIMEVNKGLLESTNRGLSTSMFVSGSVSFPKSLGTKSIIG